MQAKGSDGAAGRVGRRKVLKGIAGSAAALAFGSTFLPLVRGESRGDKPAVLGSGRHTYEVVRDWGKLPEGLGYGNTHGVQVDSQGRVYVHHQGEPSVCVFDSEGKYIRSWGKEYAAGAHGLQLVKEGKEEFLWLSLTGLHKVVKTTLEGKAVLELPFPSQCAAYEGKVERYVPTNLAVAPGGDIYVADGYGLSWIHQFDARGSYIRSFGGPGNEAGKLNCPHGIWIDTRGKVPEVLVADRANVRLQSFSLDGKPLAIVREELRHPCHFDEREGDLLVPDLHGRVSIFDRENKLVVHLGDNVDPAKRGRNDLAREGWVEGQFVAPHGATWDSKGNIYVAEWVRVGRVTKLRRVG